MTEGGQLSIFEDGLELDPMTAIVALAALIHAYGKPLDIPRDWVNALPDNAYLICEQTEEGRRFWIKET